MIWIETTSLLCVLLLRNLETWEILIWSWYIGMSDWLWCLSHYVIINWLCDTSLSFYLAFDWILYFNHEGMILFLRGDKEGNFVIKPICDIDISDENLCLIFLFGLVYWKNSSIKYLLIRYMVIHIWFIYDARGLLRKLKYE